MMLAANAPVLKDPKPNFIYAQGIGSFLEVIGIPAAIGISFGLMAFTTFVYDTLDVCTRLGRYILQELFGWRDAKGRWVATGLTAAAPLYFVLRTQLDATGKPVAAWKMFWALFGASNQLLAALTLLGITVWLVRACGARWAWAVTGVPTVWMYVMSVWALVTITLNTFARTGAADPVAWVGLVLLGLAALMLVEGVRILFGVKPAPPVAGQPVPATG
jgi:carbon starvation protein